MLDSMLIPSSSPRMGSIIFDKVFIDVTPKYARWEIAIFGAYLAHRGNSVIKDMMLVWPLDSRVKVDWLSPEETIKMIDAAIMPLERMLIHLELQVGLRQCEVIRLRIKDLHPFGKTGYMDVLGKGRCGGKWRTLSYTRNTIAILDAYLKERDRIIAEARALDPCVVIPEQLLIYRKGKKLGYYKETAIDNILQVIAKRAGIERRIGNHTNRRSQGRNSHMAGVPIEEISENYGHEDTKQTMDYLGLTIDDLSKMHDMTDDFLDEVRRRMERDKTEKPERLGRRVNL
jgi:integrase/recombinase XerD